MGQKSPGSPDGCASRAEIGAAIDGLSPADTERLDRSAELRAAGLKGLGLGVCGDDLLQEAMRLALEGSRRWPKGVRFVTYLLQLVRNVAGHAARRAKSRLGVSVEDQPEVEVVVSGDPDCLVASAMPDPERLAAARETTGRIKKKFAKDETVSLIIEGWETEMTGRDIRTELGLSQNDYETAVTRLRRGARKLEE
jgi:DNA-directed RNA polymerase specialized sigma24 family protein